MHKFAITALSVLAGMAFVQCAAAADSDVYDRGAKGDLAAFGGATRIKGDMAAAYAEQIKLASEKHAKNVILSRAQADISRDSTHCPSPDSTPITPSTRRPACPTM